jgi:hypothetical protein
MQQTRGEEVVRCAIVGIGFTTTELLLLLLESAAARTVLYTIGVVGFVLIS